MTDRDDVEREVAILKGAVENTNEAFVTIDETHKVYFFNRAAEAIFGYSREEILGRDLDVIMAPGCSRDHRQAVARYVKTRVPGRIGHATELVATRKNGETFPASISFSVFQLEGKLFFTAIIRDLTETRALQDQVMRAERLAALGQAVAEIVHEIRNPLMMIGGFANQLVKEAVDKNSLKKLGIISEEVSRLDRLLNDLREFYRPGSARRAEIELNALLREVYAMVRDPCDKQGIETVLRPDPRPLRIMGDEERLKQVLLNLVKNAMEAMEGGGHLTIEARAVGEKAEVTIADNGPGIPPKDLQRIFTPFYTTKRHGTGLGLSVSKNIIEDNRGSLNLRSREGEGTTFEILLPLISGQEAVEK